MILLFEDTATTFETLGNKILQPLLATVRKEDNGDYVLNLRDRAENYQLYVKDMIIAVDTPWGRQGFRIDKVKLNGSKVDVKAWHLFYDTKNYIIEDSYIVSNDGNYALDHLNSATDQTSPFTTTSDVATVFSLRSVRDSLYEAVLKVVERWGGHLELDNWQIGLSENVGQDRGVTVAFAKNITGFQIAENWDDVVTKLLPVGKDGLMLDPIYVENEPADYNKPYSKVITFNQSQFNADDYRDEDGNVDETAYTTALTTDLDAQAVKHLADNHYPKVNYSVDAFIEGITDIGDTIRVKHPRLNTPLITNVLAIEYNAVAEVIDKVEFGNFNPKLQNLVSDTNETITTSVEQAKTDVTTGFEVALHNATNAINGILGNSYVIYEGDQILVVDALPKEDAVNVMRINAGGIGFSTDGINGTFSSAWTIDGTLDMQQVNVINLVANQIKGGNLRLGFFEGNSGLIEIYDALGNEVGQIDENGIVLNNPNGDRLEISPTTGLSAYSSISGTEVEVFSIDRDITDIAKLNARDQIQMTPIKIVPIASGDQAGWAFVKLDT
jgi:phage minor structural protein